MGAYCYRGQIGVNGCRIRSGIAFQGVVPPAYRGWGDRLMALSQLALPKSQVPESEMGSLHVLPDKLQSLVPKNSLEEVCSLVTPPSASQQ